LKGVFYFRQPSRDGAAIAHDYRRPEQSLNREVKFGLCRIGFFLIRQSFVVPIVCSSNQSKFTRITKSSKSITKDI
jgi:hypothetical protein